MTDRPLSPLEKRIALARANPKRADRPARSRASQSTRLSAKAIRAAWKRGFDNPMT